MNSSNRVLVLGATGGIGGEVARQLRTAGWEVKALTRGVAENHAERSNGITWLRGDALCREDVAAAAEGCSVIVHAVNPPGYRRWSELVLPMLDNTIAAAAAQQAAIVLPGTVYNYGPDAFDRVTEQSPQNPVTRKGAIRVEMERRLKTFSTGGGRVLIVRAGDFFGPGAGNNWFSQGLIKPGSPVTRISYPGTPGLGHQWSYLPDVARAIVELLARRHSLERFATFHMKGHWDDDGTEMVRAVQRVVARRTATEPAVGAFPWWFIALAAPFVATFREMLEMRYLWKIPLRMDNARLEAVIGAEPHTALDQAVEVTLERLQCLQASESRGPARSVMD